MRALTLSLTGFRSYPTTVTIDFTGKNLAAALGDTGAGKSSLLDAITYALFRKSSWDARESRQLIADGAKAMSVEFTFLHDGHRWRVHRTTHATNPNAGRHHLTNLDTGLQEDGASAVDARIKAVLQMGYDTFLRVGLLPQGKFDQLLTATPKERSERLRELFGADSLQATQQLANRHCLSLTKLLGDAKAARDRMPDDPTQVAEAAGAAADAADAMATRLNTAISDITALQDQARDARTAASAAVAARQALLDRSVPDATSTLDNLEPLATDIASRRDALDRRYAATTGHDDELSAKIADFEERGEGQKTLGKAATLLEHVAARTDEHRDERDRLAALTTQLATEGEAIAEAEADLERRAQHAQPLLDAVDTAVKADSALRAHATTVRSRVAAATAAATRVADAVTAHDAAKNTFNTARDTVPLLQQKVTTAETGLTTAEENLELLRLRERAAAIAVDLRPGDDCPVCHRQLAANFESESAASAGDLRDAKTQVRQAKAALDTAAKELAHAHASVTAAESAVSAHAADHQAAQQKTRKAEERATRVLAEFASLATEAKALFDADTATTVLLAVTAKLALPSDDSAIDPDLATEPISAALASCEQDSVANIERLRTDAHRHTASIDTERELLNAKAITHQNATTEAKAATSRHTRALARTTTSIRGLPRRIREMLPDEAIDISEADATAAAAAVAAQIDEVRQLHNARDKARAEKTTIVQAQRTLDHEARHAVDKPLNTLRGALAAWANAAADARTALGLENGPTLPEALTEPDISDVRVYAAELAQLATTLAAKLTEAEAAYTARAEQAHRGLREHATTLVDVDGFDPDADLTTPRVLHPLVAAAATATTQANDQRSAQHTALAQIKPAADLTFAIAAGQARLDALDVLRLELVDAKFLGHLTALNTRTLLGIASDWLKQLTDHRFGFAPGFEIVSLASGVTHNPNRLSGGEKFLASLALALALALLHSHSGPRLGSLFLDEGFAALDTTALHAALDALRTQAGGDRLVMVISHLHAVAEAVDDVLWVQRGAAGSTARWLTPAERDELVQADLVSGLQNLA